MTTFTDATVSTLASKYRPALELALSRVLSTRDAVGDAWPYHADEETGHWATTDDGDWCDGHYVEMLRMAGEALEAPELRDEARRRTERIRYKLELDDQFRGHRFYYSAARLHASTGDQDMRTLALAAAYAVRSMAMPINGAMPIGTQVQVQSTTLASRSIVAIDNLHPNLILDWWAARETGDETFTRGARRMAEVVERHFLRPDGSTAEFVEFDPASGSPMRQFTLLGLHDDSCWSRGHAWAIAGTLLGYETTRDPYYLELCEPMFDYWWSKCAADVPRYDFADTDPAAPLDTAASVIVTSALARLVGSVEGPGAARALTARLEPMLDGVLTHVTRADDADRRPAGMLINSCFNYPRRVGAVCESLWGDYYLLETLWSLVRGPLA